MRHRKCLPYISLVLIVFGATLEVHAIGDSGGCGDPLQGPLGKALKTGTPGELEIVIQNWVNYKEKNLARTQQFAQTDEAKSQWRAKEIANIIEGRHEKGSSCVPGPLLTVAVQAGNLDVVSYLLGTPMGVKPTIPADILFSCKDGIYDIGMPEDQRLRRRRAFGLILDTKMVNVNGAQMDLTPIQACVAPELLSLFLERGANPNVVRNGAAYSNVSLLDSAVDDATGYEEGSWTARRLRGIERAKLFASIGMDSIVGHSIEKKVHYSCNLVINEKRWNENTCRELSKFIKASTGTFGNN